MLGIAYFRVGFAVRTRPREGLDAAAKQPAALSQAPTHGPLLIQLRPEVAQTGEFEGKFGKNTYRNSKQI